MQRDVGGLASYCTIVKSRLQTSDSSFQAGRPCSGRTWNVISAQGAAAAGPCTFRVHSTSRRVRVPTNSLSRVGRCQWHAPPQLGARELLVEYRNTSFSHTWCEQLRCSLSRRWLSLAAWFLTTPLKQSLSPRCAAQETAAAHSVHSACRLHTRAHR